MTSKNFERLFLAASVTLFMFKGIKSAWPSETCKHVVKYLWSFQPEVTPPEKTAWNALSERSKKLNGAKRLAAPGVAEKIFAYPFPSIPSKVSASMSKESLSKIQQLYYRYVLLSRSIEDTWADQYEDDHTASAMQRFVAERKVAIEEMNRVARAAKEELINYTFRVQNCFNEYEEVAISQIKHQKASNKLPNAIGTADAYGPTEGIDLDSDRGPASKK